MSPDRPARPVPPVRLVACDLDGTLLEHGGRVPADLAPLLAELQEAGVLFVPASGRSAPSVEALFAGVLPTADGGPTVIADNGACLVRAGRTEVAAAVPDDVVAAVVRAARAHAAEHRRQVVVVLCTPRMAYVDCPDGPLLEEVEGYYAAALARVPDLLEPGAEASALRGSVIKVAVADLDGAAGLADDVLAPFAGAVDVVRSGAVWVDLMPQGVNKGSALRRLQAELGVRPGETAAFGDHLNDLEMLAAAEHSYAVDGAQPAVVAAARLRAAGPGEGGVLQVLRSWLPASPATSEPVPGADR
ncbi:HAD-IIB family hydrolase [Nocardioides sp. TRM66260-LWL]|uniref:HAD family hydrolase n=1 Tax=Nocardioides sp. TRM66260-LWL TaxID=2874478 RepID=UPI001CC59BEE|nr:HAD-IIB family hydrolase [Nocardioides sp. TRM66260-LWL]MBZ5734101.1 HAD-IIB family hydrolase [Nocardioides sp. TRM66260-LWL]